MHFGTLLTLRSFIFEAIVSLEIKKRKQFLDISASDPKDFLAVRSAVGSCIRVRLRLRCVSESSLFIKRIVSMLGLPNESSGIKGEKAPFFG